nr:hypothetical protein [Tanacetum cinerariifolium]
MSTLVFVDLEISTQADGAQNPRVPVPLPEDPYEAIRQAYLVGTDTGSEPFKDPVKTKAPESPHTVAPPTSLLDSTPPTLVPILCAHMVVRGLPAMSPGLSASITKGTSELGKDDDDEEGDDEEEDGEIEESLDSDSVSEDAKDEGPTTEDENLAARDEGLAAGDEGPGIAVESLSLGGDEAVLEGQQQAAQVMKTALGQSFESVPDSERPKRVSTLRQPTLTNRIYLEDGIAYIDVPAYPPPAPPAQTLPSPEWSSGSLLISLAPSIVPSPISPPMILLTVPSPIASPSMAETEGFLTELGARVEMQRGLIHDHTIRLGELSPALFKRYDRDIGELFTRSGEVRDDIFS